MDRMFEIVLLALIFGGFDQNVRSFVAGVVGPFCPEFRLPRVKIDFNINKRPTETECITEVPERQIYIPSFHIIDNFERACNYYYHGHLYWHRNRFLDRHKVHKERVSWYNQGYAIRKWDLDGPEEVATGISEGILRVDRLYRRKNMIQNDSTVIYEDIITSLPKGGDFKVQLCSFIVNESVKGNFEFYGEGSFNILWEPCTQRNSSVFYCVVPTIDDKHFASITNPVTCNPGYEGFYCILKTDSCEHHRCTENGQCFLGVDGDRCLCVPGFNGRECKEMVNPCIGVTCNNRGNCTVKNDYSVCVCNDENYTGAFCERRRPGLVGPLINGPLQDVFATMLTHQGTPCENFEMNYMRCMEAYGQILGKRYCDLELRDFYECVYKTKRENRFMTIRHERSRQFLNGDRDRLFEKDKLPPHSTSPDYFSHNRIL